MGARSTRSWPRRASQKPSKRRHLGGAVFAPVRSGCRARAARTHVKQRATRWRARRPHHIAHGASWREKISRRDGQTFYGAWGVVGSPLLVETQNLTQVA